MLSSMLFPALLQSFSFEGSILGASELPGAAPALLECARGMGASGIPEGCAASFRFVSSSDVLLNSMSAEEMSSEEVTGLAVDGVS